MSDEKLKAVEECVSSIVPLCPEITTDIRIVPSSKVTNSRGSEYAILFYSEKKDNYLANIGYIGEQIDLRLPSLGIGSLWYGIGRPLDKKNGDLPFVIMMLASKRNKDDFRKDMFASKRKPLEDIWEGDGLGVSDIVRFAPSACNTQNWLVKNDGKLLLAYRRKHTTRGIMPINKVGYYNRIDLGIFLCFLEICLEHESISFARSLFVDSGLDEDTLFAEYSISRL